MNTNVLRKFSKLITNRKYSDTRIYNVVYFDSYSGKVEVATGVEGLSEDDVFDKFNDSNFKDLAVFNNFDNKSFDTYISKLKKKYNK